VDAKEGDRSNPAYHQKELRNALAEAELAVQVGEKELETIVSVGPWLLRIGKVQRIAVNGSLERIKRIERIS
jgi:hypothetical protein